MENIRRRRPRRSKFNYLLSGLFTCSICGTSMHGNLVTSRGEKRAYYVCTAKSPGLPSKPKCIPSSVQAGKIEPLIWEKVVQWFTDPSSFQEEIKRQYQPGGGEGLRQQIKFVEQNIYNIKKQREKILALFQKDLLIQEEVEERLKEFNVNLEKLNQQKVILAEEVEQQKSYEVKPEEMQHLFAAFKERIEELDFEERRKLVRLLVDQVLVSNGEVLVKLKLVCFKFKYPDLPQEMESLC